MELAIRGSNLDAWPLGCFCFDKTAKALIKRPLDMALIKWPGPAADKLIARDTTAIGPSLDKTAAFDDTLIARGNIELAIRGSNLDVWPLGCSLIKRPLGLALIERPLD